VIFPAQELNAAIRPVANQIPGFVKALSQLVAEGAPNKSLCRQFWPVEVASGQADTADMQLT
jgi:hypothetical protein